MIKLRVGTRGSQLALTQTRAVCDMLRAKHPGIDIEEVIIQSQGDAEPDRPLTGPWTVGVFVKALEQALVDRRIDFAVHSCKDLPTKLADGLMIAAVPPRESVHDVLVTQHAINLEHVPVRFRIGSSSPRRAAQLRRLGPVEIVPIRGNVPTRLGKIGNGLDGVILAAAGLNRLGIHPPHKIDLPIDRFVPAPGQGALAIEARVNDAALPFLATLDDSAVHACVRAERSFLIGINANCQTPAAALARCVGNELHLRAQLFSDDGIRVAEAESSGRDPEQLGLQMASRIRSELGAAP